MGLSRVLPMQNYASAVPLQKHKIVLEYNQLYSKRKPGTSQEIQGKPKEFTVRNENKTAKHNM